MFWTVVYCGGSYRDRDWELGFGVLRANEGTALVDKVKVRIGDFRGTWVYPEGKRDKLKLSAVSPLTEGLLPCASCSWAAQTRERGGLQTPAQVGSVVSGASWEET